MFIVDVNRVSYLLVISVSMYFIYLLVITFQFFMTKAFCQGTLFPLSFHPFRFGCFELGIIGLVHVHVIRAMYGGSND